jgi:hypothetical protein
MNPSILKLITSGKSEDQSASQGVSKTKKMVSGKNNKANLTDLIGGAGSFASVLRQEGMGLPVKKGNNQKEGYVNCQVESTHGQDEIESGLSGIKIGTESLSPKVAKEAESGIKIIQSGGQTPSDKDMKHHPEVLASVEVPDTKAMGKELPLRFGKPQLLKVEGNVSGYDTSNLPVESDVQDGMAGQIKSTGEKESKISLKNGVIGFGSVEKSPSVDTKPLKGETNRNLEALPTGDLKGNEPVKKNVPEGMNVSPSGGALKDHQYSGDLDLSKGPDIKELNVNKDSSDVKVKAHEALSAKDSAPQPEGTKEDMIQPNQVRTENEKIQNYKNISSDVVKSERLVERGANETPDRKIDTSLSTTQVDYSGAKGIWNGPETSMKGDSITPLNFRDVADQIMDAASNMLKKDSGRIVITLEPPNLGTLNMDIRVQHDSVRMLLVADNYEVKQVLHSNLDQLKTALQGQGLNIDRLDVLVHDRSYDGNQGFQPGGGTLFDDGRGGRNNTKEDHPALQILQAGGNELNEPSLGIISLFA